MLVKFGKLDIRFGIGIKSEAYNFLITSSQSREHLKVYMQMVG